MKRQRSASRSRFPIQLISFYREAPERIDTDAVSFRSLSRMKAKERRAAEAAGSLGIELYEWIDSRFNLPAADLIDLSKERSRPHVAARLLRQHWGIGDRPIGNVLKLIESKGIRVLSLSEATKHVDAFSFWRGEHPYVFLNQEKTAERSIFDTAHELGHLVLHHHAGSKADKEAETQADRFASAFLMPENDMMDYAHLFTVGQIISAKKRWKVSAMALAYRLKFSGLYQRMELPFFADRAWEARLSKRRSQTEIEREVSTVLAKVLAALWSKGMTKDDIAKDLGIPLGEIEALIFRLSPDQRAVNEPHKPALRVVK